MLVTAIAVGFIVAMVIQLLPLIKGIIANIGNESNMVEHINAYGLKGIPILIGLQALQIIIAFVPAAAVQILTGLCYGAYWGTLINVTGCVLGNTFVFVTVRQMQNMFGLLIKRDVKHKSFLSKEQLAKIKRPEIIVFLFFLIPGIPNGIVPYVFAETRISLLRYIAAVIAGSIPGAFMCTFLGDRLSRGNFTTATIIAVFVVAILLAVLLFRNKIIAKITPEELR